MFEGISVQFVVDVDEVRGELAAADLNWPIVKILDSEEEEEERDAEDLSVVGEGVAIYIDSIDVILKERIEKAKEIVTTVARMIQYFNERDETAVLFFSPQLGDLFIRRKISGKGFCFCVPYDLFQLLEAGGFNAFYTLELAQ